LIRKFFHQLRPKIDPSRTFGVRRLCRRLCHSARATQSPRHGRNLFPAQPAFAVILSAAKDLLFTTRPYRESLFARHPPLGFILRSAAEKDLTLLPRRGLHDDPPHPKKKRPENRGASKTQK